MYGQSCLPWTSLWTGWKTRLFLLRVYATQEPFPSLTPLPSPVQARSCGRHGFPQFSRSWSTSQLWSLLSRLPLLEELCLISTTEIEKDSDLSSLTLGRLRSLWLSFDSDYTNHAGLTTILRKLETPIIKSFRLEVLFSDPDCGPLDVDEWEETEIHEDISKLSTINNFIRNSGC